MIPFRLRIHPRRKQFQTLLLVIGLLVGMFTIAPQAGSSPLPQADQVEISSYLPFVAHNRGSVPPAIEIEYVLIGWNDLGMHCYDLDYSILSILPPYNTLWAQVIRRGDPPQRVTGGITVTYRFPNNTRSDNKTNFWEYEDKLFGVPLEPNMGLAGFGLAGEMEQRDDYFIAEGIPITEFSDSAPTTPEYLQMAELVATDSASGQELATTRVVAPVSSEMRCDTCHNESDSGDFRQDILEEHDDEEGTTLLAQANSGNPVLCAACHADPALGASGEPGVSTLSAAMHHKHAEEMPADPDLQDCYACHPGPDTRCLRDVMSTEYGMTCVDCHEGGMQALGEDSRTPWLDEPRCESCHDPQYAENPNTLYRFSLGHGGLYCESCHNSTHAILPSREDRDNAQAYALQGFYGTIQDCRVCHTVQPESGGPHQ